MLDVLKQIARKKLGNLVREKLPKIWCYYLPLRDNQTVFNINLKKQTTTTTKNTTNKTIELHFLLLGNY